MAHEFYKDSKYTTEKFNDWLIQLSKKEPDGNIQDVGFWYNDLVFRIGPFRSDDVMPPTMNISPTGYKMPGRWTRLVNEYTPDFPDFVRGPIVQKLLFYAEGSYVFNQGFDHSRGNCLSVATFGFRGKGVQTLQLTGISRSSFLVPMGPLDLNLLILMARDLARAKRSKYYRVQWYLSQGQFQLWTAAPWFHVHKLFDRVEGPIAAGFKTLLEEKFLDPALDETTWQSQRRWRATYYDIDNREPFSPLAPLVTNPRAILKRNTTAQALGSHGGPDLHSEPHQKKGVQGVKKQ